MMRITSSGSIGIGTNAPGAKLHVNGQIRINGGGAALGRVLTSDAVGLATWQIPGTQVCPGSGTGNTCYGLNAGNVIGTGTYNTAIGRSALLLNTIGVGNTAVGSGAGSNLTTGGNNIAIGANTTLPSATASNQLNI